MNPTFDANRHRMQLLQKQQLQHRKGEAAEHAREVAQHAQAERAQGEVIHGQGRHGDTVFRTLPRPPAPPPRQNRVPGQRGDPRPTEQEPPGAGQAAETAATVAPGGARHVEAIDRDGSNGHQQPSQGESRNGGSGANANGGHSGHPGGGSGGGGGGQHGGQSRDGGQQNGQPAALARFGVPAATRTAAASGLPAELAAFGDALASTTHPEQKARHLAAAMVALNKPGPGRHNVDAMMMSLMAAYVEASHEPGALNTLARVKQVLVELGPALSGVLPPGPRERNRFALLPLKLLVSDRHRTEAQRLIAAERLRAGQRWPAEVIEAGQAQP